MLKALGFWVPAEHAQTKTNPLPPSTILFSTPRGNNVSIKTFPTWNIVEKKKTYVKKKKPLHYFCEVTPSMFVY